MWVEPLTTRIIESPNFQIRTVLLTRTQQEVAQVLYLVNPFNHSSILGEISLLDNPGNPDQIIRGVNLMFLAGIDYFERLGIMSMHLEILQHMKRWAVLLGGVMQSRVTSRQSLIGDISVDALRQQFTLAVDRQTGAFLNLDPEDRDVITGNLINGHV